ncbi:hypothetical protein NHQ30_005046 [Ciborinia camelliae]|nr:hypothetical protein NHQ30_005046 [Ciborinia camelliae]
MAAVATIDDLKLLVAVLSQFAPENQVLPSPDHVRLANLLGFNDRKAAAGKWHVLTKKIKRGDFGDFGDLIVQKEPAEPVGKKRAVVEVPMDASVNETGPSPTKKSKLVFITSASRVTNANRSQNRGVNKAGKGKSKRKVVEVEDDD